MLLEIHEPDTVGQCSGQLTASMKGEAGLSDSPGAREREQTCVGERGSDGAELAAASNEARQLGWQVSS